MMTDNVTRKDTAGHRRTHSSGQKVGKSTENIHGTVSSSHNSRDVGKVSVGRDDASKMEEAGGRRAGSGKPADEGRRAGSGKSKEEGGGRPGGSGKSRGGLTDSSTVPVELREEAVVLSEEGGRRENSAKSVRRQESNPNNAPRLLVVSSKIKNSSVMNAAVLSNVSYVQYKYESATLDGILGM